MGTIIRQYGINFRVQANAQDTLSVKYLYQHDVPVIDENQAQDVMNGAWAAGLPRRRQRLGTTGLFAFDFDVDQTATNSDHFIITANYRKPEQLGPAMAAVADLHPIYHPVLNTVGYMEKEDVITKAYNRQAITGGAARAADTLGYIQNGAGVISQNVPVEIERVPILISRKNIGSLGGVLEMNRKYADGGYIRTTNSDTVTIEGKDYSPRTLKFAGVDVGEQMEFEGIPYWEAERRIEIHDTTDWTIDSVGTQFVDGDGNMVPILQYDVGGTETENEITEPIPINLDGSAGTPGTSVQIDYYYLTEVPYAPLVS